MSEAIAYHEPHPLLFGRRLGQTVVKYLRRLPE